MSIFRPASIAALVYVLCFCAPAFAGAAPNPAEKDAERELFAARYEKAVTLYSDLVKQPGETDAWYGLVRAQLGLHHSREAYAAADQALSQAPGSAGAHTAVGFAMYRRGDLAQAEDHFRSALKIDPNYPGALKGLASIYSTISLFKSARNLRLKAFKASPDDPELIITWANTLKGKDHIAALEDALARLDQDSDQARAVRVHIANDVEAGDRKLRRLVSPYQSARVKLFRLLDGPLHPRGLGVAIRLNQKQTVKLLLDTGSSGISISPKMAEKAGLQVLGGAPSEVKGIGDEKTQSSLAYLASEVQVGDVTFADYPISVFRSAQSADFDGLIGADVFDRFLVKIDFVQVAMALDTRPEGLPDVSEEPRDWHDLPAGFHRVYRFGDHLVVPTLINEKRSTLFLVDSGSTSNLIGTAVAKEVTGVTWDRATVVGVQGKVDKVSRADRISLIFAGFRQDNPDLLSISLEKMSDSMGVGLSGILGMPVLRNLVVTLDYRIGAIKFDYNKP